LVLAPIAEKLEGGDRWLSYPDDLSMMDLKQLVIRSFSLEQDVPLLLGLYSAIEASDHSGMDVSEKALRGQLELPGHDPQKDRWVVESSGVPARLLASALIQISPASSMANTNILVDPEWRRQGIGTVLLSRVMSRAHELRASTLQIYASTDQPAALGFLQKNGFELQGAYTELRLAEGTRLPPVIWPFGYTMRTYAEVQNLTTLTEAMNQSYIPLWGHHELREQEMASWLPQLNQQGLFLVFSEKSRVVGISRAEPSTERTLKNGVPTGYIDAPGVVPQHRRLDLYRALVLTGIRWLQSQGNPMIEMESWGDKLEVLKMYRELGFKDLRQLLCFQKDLLSGDALP
jgi:mycothiol synthase